MGEEDGKERGMDRGDLADPNSASIGFFLNEGPEARAAAKRYSEYWMLPPPILLSFNPSHILKESIVAN